MTKTGGQHMLFVVGVDGRAAQGPKKNILSLINSAGGVRNPCRRESTKVPDTKTLYCPPRYAHIPVWDRNKVAPVGKVTRADFVYDKVRDLYICPGGKMLKTSGSTHDGTAKKLK